MFSSLEPLEAMTRRDWLQRAAAGAVAVGGRHRFSPRKHGLKGL